MSINKYSLMPITQSQLNKFKNDELSNIMKTYKIKGRSKNKPEKIELIVNNPQWEQIKNDISLPVRPKKKFSKKQLEVQRRFAQQHRRRKKIGVKELRQLNDVIGEMLDFERLDEWIDEQIDFRENEDIEEAYINHLDNLKLLNKEDIKELSDIQKVVSDLQDDDDKFREVIGSFVKNYIINNDNKVLLDELQESLSAHKIDIETESEKELRIRQRAIRSGVPTRPLNIDELFASLNI